MMAGNELSSGVRMLTRNPLFDIDSEELRLRLIVSAGSQSAASETLLRDKVSESEVVKLSHKFGSLKYTETEYSFGAVGWRYSVDGDHYSKIEFNLISAAFAYSAWSKLVNLVPSKKYDTSTKVQDWLRISVIAAEATRAFKNMMQSCSENDYISVKNVMDASIPSSGGRAKAEKNKPTKDRLYKYAREIWSACEYVSRNDIANHFHTAYGLAYSSEPPKIETLKKWLTNMPDIDGLHIRLDGRTPNKYKISELIRGCVLAEDLLRLE